MPQFEPEIEENKWCFKTIMEKCPADNGCLITLC